MMSDQDRLADITRRYKPGVNDDIDYLLNQLTHAQMATERLRGLGQDGCPLCGSTRFTEEPIDVSSEGRIRFVPGLRRCLDCHDGGAPVLLAEVERLRGLLARLEWAGGMCPACHVLPSPDRHLTGHAPHDPDCWLAAELGR